MKISRPMQGIATYRNDKFGADVVVIHYTADSIKRLPGWAEKESQRLGGMDSPDWLQEYDLRFDAMRGTLVFPAYSVNRNVVDPFTIKPGWDIVLSADWGYSAPTAMHAWAINPDTKVHYCIAEVYHPLSVVDVQPFKVEMLNKIAEAKGLSLDVIDTESLFGDNVGDPEDPGTMAAFGEEPYPFYFRGNVEGARWRLNDVAVGEYRTNTAMKMQFVCCNRRQVTREYAAVGACLYCQKENKAEPLLQFFRDAAPYACAQIPTLQRKDSAPSEEILEKSKKTAQHACDSVRYHVQSDQSWFEDVSGKGEQIPELLKVPFHKLSAEKKLWVEAAILASRNREEEMDDPQPGEIIFDRSGHAFMVADDEEEPGYD